MYIIVYNHIYNGYMYIYTHDMDPYQPRDHWRVWGSSGPVLLQQEMEMAEKAQRGYQTMGHLE
jgi:hypothetical protein